MLLVLPPGKQINVSPDKHMQNVTLPVYQQQAENIVSIMKGRSVEDLMDMYNVSKSDAEQIYMRFQRFDDMSVVAGEALFAPHCEFFDALGRESYNEDDFAFLEKSSRILSPLYGLLKPSDLIKDYTFSFFIKINELGADSVLEYWKDLITQQLTNVAQDTGNEILVIPPDAFLPDDFAAIIKNKVRLVRIKFRDWLDGEWKITPESEALNKAELVKLIISKKIVKIEDLRGMTINGYMRDDNLSGDEVWIYTRSQSDEPEG